MFQHCILDASKCFVLLKLHVSLLGSSTAYAALAYRLATLKRKEAADQSSEPSSCRRDLAVCCRSFQSPCLFLIGTRPEDRPRWHEMKVRSGVGL